MSLALYCLLLIAAICLHLSPEGLEPRPPPLLASYRVIRVNYTLVVTTSTVTSCNLETWQHTKEGMRNLEDSGITSSPNQKKILVWANKKHLCSCAAQANQTFLRSSWRKLMTKQCVCLFGSWRERDSAPKRLLVNKVWANPMFHVVRWSDLKGY